MKFELLWRRGPFLAASAASVFQIAGLLDAAPARAAEDTNVFNSMLGFFGMQFDKDPDAIDYRARPPLVVPPKLDLPPPKETVRAPDWPKDPDVAAQRRAALDSRRPAPQITPNTRAELPPSELEKGKATLPQEGPADDCQGDSTKGICISAPWRVLKSVANIFQPETVQPGPEPPRKFLTDPPPGYRTATGAAEVTPDAPKDRPDAADAGAFIRSQRHKLSVDN